ncbi:hypothetical protein [Streptomyces rubradiris]|uniref:UDP-N-acetylglucosamine kinase n=1 Tax=Streptomyces rubradiris TaxID=285531 RepID=A0ABQ3R8J1_STRRR|nr:hypothetical protein GCM10018792_59820 [Streptomyces rubradiris]GHI52162.1 hypothetical protein Srubr_20080 [Streptomyces rubradiris]
MPFRQDEPLLIAIGGPPGTGKATLARLLAARVGAVHLRNDPAANKR